MYSTVQSEIFFYIFLFLQKMYFFRELCKMDDGDYRGLVILRGLGKYTVSVVGGKWLGEIDTSLRAKTIMSGYHDLYHHQSRSLRPTVPPSSAYKTLSCTSASSHHISDRDPSVLYIDIAHLSTVPQSGCRTRTLTRPGIWITGQGRCCR